MYTREQKGNSLLELAKDYVVIDLETTGLDPQFNRIIELGAIKIKNGQEVDTFHSFVNPKFPLPEFIVSLTGITDEILANAPIIENIIENFVNFVGDGIVVGHNVNFDINFIYDNYAECCEKFFNNDFVDTMRLARRCELDVPDHRLCTLVNYFKIKQSSAHRALDDCRATNELFVDLKNYILKNNVDLSKRKYNSKISAIHSNVEDVYEDNPFFHKTVVFTGALKSMLRKEAAQIVANLGGILADSITKKTNFLVLGNLEYSNNIKEGKSSKLRKAEQLILAGADLKILSENVFSSMISEK